MQQPMGAPGAMVASPNMAPMAAGPHGPIGTVRNPIMVFLLSSICFIYGMVAFFSMIGELKAFRKKDDINLIMFFIPILNILELLKLPAKVSEAKQMAGAANPNAASPLLYFLLGIYFLPADLNEVWEAAQRRAGGM